MFEGDCDRLYLRYQRLFLEREANSAAMEAEPANTGQNSTQAAPQPSAWEFRLVLDDVNMHSN